MSDAPQGPGWWMASDGRWYPPEAHRDNQPPPAPPQSLHPGTPAPLPAPGHQPPLAAEAGRPPEGRRGTNTLAVVSLVLGLLWGFGLFAALALIFGLVAKSQIRRRHQGGDGLAVAGIVLGAAGLAAAGVLLGAYVGGRSGDDDGALAPVPPASLSPRSSSSATRSPTGVIRGDTPCPRPQGEERVTRFRKAPPMCIDLSKGYRAVFTTTAGVVEVELDTVRTPRTVNNFVVLARYRYYDGTSFMRTDPSIDIIQGGAPSQSISDPGPGYTIEDEGRGFTYAEGDLVMARSGAPDSASAQYFFAAGPNTANLNADGSYVTFGKVVEGLDVLRKVLSTHVDCPNPDRAPNCLGGAPRPPVTVQSVTIRET